MLDEACCLSSSNFTCLDKARLKVSHSCVGFQAMEESFAASSRYIEQQAVRAVAALASPAWTAHIIGTAAALVAENAKKICAQQIIHQVRTLGLNSHTTCCFPFCAFVMTTWRSTYRAMQNYTCCTCWPAMLGRTMFTSYARCMNTHRISPAGTPACPKADQQAAGTSTTSSCKVHGHSSPM